MHLFGELEAYEKLGKEFQLLTCNHRCNLDWVCGYTLAFHYNFLKVRLEQNSYSYKT